jgi:hypothetical protein
VKVAVPIVDREDDAGGPILHGVRDELRGTEFSCGHCLLREAASELFPDCLSGDPRGYRRAVEFKAPDRMDPLPNERRSLAIPEAEIGKPPEMP